jgi:exopolysaccharide biosynthesis polyprenyl glycosylphosphotransferase
MVTTVRRYAMKPRWHSLWRALAASADALFITGALTALAIARFGLDAVHDGFVPAPGREFAQAPLLLATPVWLAVYAAARLYSPQRCHNGLEEGRRLVTAGLGAAVALVLLGFLIKEPPARSWVVGGMVIGTLSAAAGRMIVRTITARLRTRGHWTTPTVVVGRRQAKAVIDDLLADPGSGIDPVAVCGFEWGPSIPSWQLSDVKEAVRATGAGEVLVVAEDLERHEVSVALEAADDLPVHVVVLPGLDHLLLGSLHLTTVMREPGLRLEPPSVHGYQTIVKRVMDVVVGGALLVASAPLMAAIAAAIRIDSRGPAIFRQKREGRGGTTFDALKFRTMVDGAPPNTIEQITPEDMSFLAKPEDDPRITRVGRWLRRTSLDELPQLWSVVRGDMSLVGPRPLPLWEAERLGLHRRLIVRPGLTGLWQVSGRSRLSPDERIRLDLVYVQNWSVLLDLSILLRTLPAVIGGNGAY